MKKFDQYKNALNELPDEKRGKLKFIQEVAYHNSMFRRQVLISHYHIKRKFALPKYKGYQAFLNDELFKASEDLTRIKLNISLKRIYNELTDIRKDIEKKDLKNDTEVEISSDFFNWLYNNKDGFLGVFAYLIISSGLALEYLDKDIDYQHTKPKDFDIKNLKDLDKIIEFLAQFWFLLGLIIGFKKIPSKTEINNRFYKLSFIQLFRSEHRAQIPNEVIRLLGPTEADAWETINKKKIWVFKGPESAIMIPFYILCNKGFIEIPSRGKKDFITVWVKEFGKDYKEKTFDKVPKNYEATEHFTEYLDKL
jgi:hypothetical protein